MADPTAVQKAQALLAHLKVAERQGGRGFVTGPHIAGPLRGKSAIEVLVGGESIPEILVGLLDYIDDLEAGVERVRPSDPTPTPEVPRRNAIVGGGLDLS